VYSVLSYIQYSGYNVLIEDALIVGLFFLVILNFIQGGANRIKGIIVPITLFFLLGVLLFINSVLMKGMDNIFSDFRIYFFVFFGISSVLAFRDRSQVFRLLSFILTLWFVGLAYQYYDRVDMGGWLFFAKGQSYKYAWFDYFGFVVAIGFIFSSCKIGKLMRLLIHLGIFLYLLTGILEMSRGIWLATSVFIFLYTFMNIKRSGKRAFLYIFFLACFVAIIYTLSSFKQINDILTISGTAYTRLEAWKILLDRVLDYPLIGHGFGAKGVEINMVIKEYASHRGIYIGTAHNAHLIMAYHIGFVGVLSYVALSGLLMYKTIKIGNYDKFSVSMQYAVLAGFCGWYLSSMTTPLGPNFSYHYWFYTILLMIFYSLNRYEKMKKITSSCKLLRLA